MPVYALGPHRPIVDPTATVTETAVVIGKVELHANSSVWFGATLRGDNEPIVIGKGSNVQEGAVLHTDPGSPLHVGENVTVGHQAMLHGCTIGTGSLIGIQAIVLNGARVGSHCLIGAGALIAEGKEIPDGSLVMGSPGRVVRSLSDSDRENMLRIARNYSERAAHYRAGLSPLEQRPYRAD